MTVQSRSTYQQAIAAGMPFWRLQISNWGNRGVNSDANSLEYVPDQPVNSAQYIVMGPDSTADEVLIAYSDRSYAPALLQKQFDDLNSAFPPGDTSNIIVSVGLQKPGIMLPGPLKIRTAYSTQFYNTYFRDGDTAEYNFGGAEPLCERPTLQLLVFPEVPTVVPTLRRNDMYRSAVTTSSEDAGEEQLIGIWPVMGRSCKSLYFRATGDLVCSVRVGAISYFVSGDVNTPDPRPVEDTVTTANLSAVTGAQESITTGRPMQWIAAYLTKTSGAGDVITNLIAQDC